MRSLSKKFLDTIILDLSVKYGVEHMALVSMINSVFKFYLRKFTDMRDESIINMPGLGRFYPGQVAKRNKARWIYLNALLEEELKKHNINYE